MQWERESDQSPQSRVQSDCVQHRPAAVLGCSVAQAPVYHWWSWCSGEYCSFVFTRYKVKFLTWGPYRWDICNFCKYCAANSEMVPKHSYEDVSQFVMRAVILFHATWNGSWVILTKYSPLKQLLITTSGVFLEILRSRHKISPFPPLPLPRPWPEP